MMQTSNLDPKEFKQTSLLNSEMIEPKIVDIFLPPMNQAMSPSDSLNSSHFSIDRFSMLSDNDCAERLDGEEELEYMRKIVAGTLD